MAEIFNFYVQDNRSIQFPKANLLEPIMQEDHNVAVWRFRIPKVLNDIDMSAWAWWFVYTNAKNEKFSELLTLVDDIDEPDSYCTADYSINYGVSYHPGSFQFSLEAVNADSGGEVLNEWHTKTYAHKVNKTLQGNQVEYAETESDIISALIVEVQNKVRQLTGGATPEPKNLVANMTDPKKVYLYVGNEVDESNGYWYYHNGTKFVPGGLYASGITVDSVPTQGSNNAVRSGGVYEELSAVPQENVIPFPYNSGDSTVNGLTFTVNDDWSVTINGTATADTNFYFATTANAYPIKAGTYTLSGCTDGSSSTYRLYFAVKDATNTTDIVSFMCTTAPVTKSVPEDGYIRASIFVKSGATLDNVTIKPMFEKGSIAREYVSPALTSTALLNLIDLVRSKAVYPAGKSIQALGISDANNLENNRIYSRSSTSYAIDNLPYDDWLGTIITFAFSDNAITSVQVAFSRDGEMHYRINWGASQTWKNWVEFSNFDDVVNIIHKDAGYVGSYAGTFTAQEVLHTGIQLEADTTYVVKFYDHRTGNINIYRNGDSSNYKRVFPCTDEITFVNGDTAGELCLYNIHSQLDSVSIKVYKPDSKSLKTEYVPKTYRVTTDPHTGDYTSLTKCLYDLKDDVSPKIIEVWEGDYNIFDEYKELWNAGLLDIYTGSNPDTEYFDYCVWVPKNTHIIGKGIVRLIWMPDPAVDTFTSAQTRCISPLNVAATATIENVEVYCKNGRYCLHNDGLGKPEFAGAVQKYINCKMYKYEHDKDEHNVNYGFLHCTGFGIDRAMHHVYENCTFVHYGTGAAFYGHTRSDAISSENQNSDIILTNCVCITQGATSVKLGGGSASKLHLRMLFNNCYMDNKILLDSQSDERYDMQLLNCGNVSMQITAESSAYPPQAYNTNLTMV